MRNTNKLPRRALLASATIAALSLSIGAAWAQDQAETAHPDSAAKSSGANGVDKNSATSLPAVIVTAEKRTQDVSKVPSSISVVNSELLENQHVASLVDLRPAARRADRQRWYAGTDIDCDSWHFVAPAGRGSRHLY